MISDLQPADATLSTGGIGNRAKLLLALCVAGFGMPLTFTGISVALPAIGADLNAGTVGLSWVINAFVLAFGGFIMAAGTLADRYGRKRMMSIGIVLFTAASLAGAFSTHILLLNLLRGVQGLGAAITMASAAAAVAHAFRGPSQTKAFALLGTTFGAGFALGPVVVGAATQLAGWRSVFFISTALGLTVMAVMALANTEESRDPDANELDIKGTASFVLTLLLINFGLLEAPSLGWGHPLVVGLLIGGAASLALFIAVERAQPRPMLDLSLFRNARFLGVQSLPIAAACGFIVPVAMLPLRFVGAEGMTQSEAGLALLPLCLPMTFVPLVGGYLTRWISPGIVCAVGLMLAALGLWALSGVPVGAGAAAFVWPMIAMGVGVSLPWGLMDGLAVAVVPKERAGMAVGFFGAVRLVSEGTAIVVTAAILSGLLQGRLAGIANGSAVAGELTAGNFAKAVELAGGAGSGAGSRLLDAYSSAFSLTMLVLAAMTFVSALVALLAVRQTHEQASAAPAAVSGLLEPKDCR
ncbi:MFS transporter [soil metagenome]